MGQMSMSGKHLRGHQHIFAAHLVLSNAIVAVAVAVPVPVPVPVSIPSVHRGKSKIDEHWLSKIKVTITDQWSRCAHEPTDLEEDTRPGTLYRCCCAGPSLTER